MTLLRQRRLIVYLLFMEHLRLNERIRREANPVGRYKQRRRGAFHKR